MKKTLLVCLDNLGDLVFASALARSLGSTADRELHLWCKEYCAPIGKLLPTVTKVHAADPFWRKSPGATRGGSFLRFWRILYRIRNEHYDEAFIVSNCWRTAIAVWLAGIAVRIAPRGRRNALWLTNIVAMPPLNVPAAAGWVDSFMPYLATERYRHCLLTFTGPPDLTRFTFLAAGQPVVVLHPFAGHVRRCARMEFWQLLSKWLTDKGYFIIFTGSSTELQRWRDGLPGWDGSHYSDTWTNNLCDLAKLWSCATLFIGHDSGPAHIAHALRVPTLGLYLPGEPLRTFPQGEAAYRIIVKDSPAELALEEAIATVQELMNAPCVKKFDSSSVDHQPYDG